MDRSRQKIALVVAAALFGIVSSAQAQSVGGSCPTAGWTAWAQINPGELLYCNGTTWGLAEAITDTGLVGIGTASPVVSLDLSQKTDAIALPVGTTGQRPTPANGMIRYNSSTPAIEGYVNGTWEAFTTGSLSIITLGTSTSATNPQVSGDATTGLFSPAASTVAVATGGTERLRINSSGYVGIGTASPANLLQAYGAGSPIISVYGTGTTGFPGYNITTPTHQYNVQSGQSGTGNFANAFYIYDNTNSATRLLITGVGNVGIGTTSPNALLDIGSAGGTLGTLRLEGKTSGYVQLQGAAAAGSWTMTLPASGGTNGYCLTTDGSGVTTWASCTSGGAVAIDLGTSASVTNPSRTGDVTTGLFSATTGTVSVAASGTDEADFASAGLNLPVPTESYKINGNNALWQDTTNFNLAVGPTAFPADVSQSGGGTNGQYNIAIGSGALNANTIGAYNIAVGNSALGLNTTGVRNVAVGWNSLINNTTGSVNTAVGMEALESNTTGSHNTAVGDNALSSNSTGQENTALGESALHANTTATFNTAVGSYALQSDTSGGNNTALGRAALTSNQTGSNNTALGAGALYNSSASYNTAVGASALLNSTASNNTALGYQALVQVTTGANNIGIGFNVGATILQTGIDNILIGTSVDTAATGTNYNLNIGNLLQGDMTNSTALGTEALYLQSTASSVDYLQIAGGATGNPGTVAISGQGTDSNVNIELLPKGTGNVGIGSTSPISSLDLSQKTDALALPAGTTGQRPSGVNGMIRYNSSTPALEAYYNSQWNALAGTGSLSTITLGTLANATNPQGSGDPTTGFYTPGAQEVAVSANGIEAMQWNALASGVDYLSITPGKSGTAPVISVAGGTTNQDLDLTAAGTGSVVINNNTTIHGNAIVAGLYAPFINFQTLPNLFQINGNSVYNNINTYTWQTSHTWLFDNFSSGTKGLWSFTPTYKAKTTTTVSGSGGLQGIYLAPIFGTGSSLTYTATSPMVALAVAPAVNVNTASTGNYVGLLVNATETSVGTGVTNYLAQFQTGGANKAVITSSGNVGIGTTSPQATLDVNGAVRNSCVATASLPTGVTGMRHCVTDATSCAFMASVTGGGSTVCPVFYNGSAWVGG